MTEKTIFPQHSSCTLRKLPRGFTGRGPKVAIAVGTLAFLAGLFLSPQRAWQAYFVNFLFWSGIAQGGVVMAAVYRITNARWGEQFRSDWRSNGFVSSGQPVSLPDLDRGRKEHLPLARASALRRKGIWLSGYFLFARDGIAFVLPCVAELSVRLSFCPS